MYIWLKKIDMNDGIEYYNLLNTLSSYKNVFAKPMAEPLNNYNEFEHFKKTRILMEFGLVKKTLVPTITYWIMLKNKPIGYAILRHKLPENKIGGNIGICLLREYQGKELGKQVIEQLSLIALNEYGLDDIYITVKKENIRCQKLMDKIGIDTFKEEKGYIFYRDDLNIRYEEEKIK